MSIKNGSVSFRRAAFVSVLLLLSALSAQSQSNLSRSGQWRIAGQNLNNTWSQPAEHSISPANVKGLTPKWVFTTGGDVSATPTVDGDAVYFPDWGGNLFAVQKENGRLIWSHKISDYDGVTGAISRVSPAVDHDQLIIGDILSSNETHAGANVIAVDRKTGALRWIKQVETHPAAIITGSPVVFDGVVYIGVSSSEETLAANPAIRVAAFEAASLRSTRRAVQCCGRPLTCLITGGARTNTAAARCGNPPRSIPSAERSSSALETITPFLQMWSLAKTQILPRTALRLTISSTRPLPWI